MTKFLTKARMARILADMKPLHSMLKDWQDELHLNSSEAARQCGMSRSQWAELVSGATSDPRASTLHKLAHGTGIPLERLVEAADLSLHPLAETATV